jgi:hypothetical protein
LLVTSTPQRYFPQYAHNELFGLKKEWAPNLKNDLASLAYSVASIREGCFPWTGFSNHNTVMDGFQINRYNIVRKCLNQLFKEWKLSSDFEEALGEATCVKKQKKRPREN